MAEELKLKIERRTKRDFNTIRNDLIKYLQFSFQHDDGTIYWYEGTLDILQEFLDYVYFHYKEDMK